MVVDKVLVLVWVANMGFILRQCNFAIILCDNAVNTWLSRLTVPTTKKFEAFDLGPVHHFKI